MLYRLKAIYRQHKLKPSWARTRTYLENAFAQLPASPIEGEEGGLVQVYQEFLDHNELELALDVLEMLGEQNPVRENFWEFLLQAATEMKLNDHAVRYQERLAG